MRPAKQTGATSEIGLAENEVVRKRHAFETACRKEEVARAEMMRVIASAIQAHEETVAKMAVAGERLERAERKLEGLQS